MKNTESKKMNVRKLSLNKETLKRMTLSMLELAEVKGHGSGEMCGSGAEHCSGAVHTCSVVMC
jgi:hypothetical protein